MKRVVSASIIALLTIGIMGGGYFYYKFYRKTSDKAIHAIPPDAAFFIEYYANAGNLKKIINSNFIADSKQEVSWQNLVSNLTKFDSLSLSISVLHEWLANSPLLISAHVTKSADFDFLYLFSLPAGADESACDDWVKIFAGEPSATVQSRNYDGVDINELDLGNHLSFTYTVTKGVFIGSYTSFLVEDAIRQQKLRKPFGNDKELFSLYEKESPHHEDKIYINYGNLKKWLAVFTENERPNPFSLIANFCKWTCLKLKAEKDMLDFKGVSIQGDSNMFMSLFSNQAQPPLELPYILPAKTAAFLYYGYSDPVRYFNNLQVYNKKGEYGDQREKLVNTLDATYKTSWRNKLQQWVGKEYALVITEPASKNYDNHILAIFSAPDTLKALKSLRELGSLVALKQKSGLTQEKYNGHVIGLINMREVLPALYGDAFNKTGRLFFTAVKGFLIISNQASSLRSFIDDFANGNFLFKKNDHDIIKRHGLGANFYLYGRIPACHYLFQAVGSAKTLNFLNSYKGMDQWVDFSFLIKNTNKGLETFASLRYNQNPNAGVNLVWSAELDTTVSNGPYFLPLSDQKYIIVQDVLNQLYLIDNAGNIVWKKPLDEPILGQINSVDVFKNGQRQLLFNTTTRLMMLDTSGNNVSSFPIRLPAEATTGLAVFDYDETNEYRIYVACNNGRIYGYQASGKPLQGWGFYTSTSKISSQIQHFKRDNQDYLIFNDDAGKTFVVGKNGEMLIDVKQLLFKSPGSSFFLDEDKEGNYSFLTLDSSGSICSIMPDGFIRTHPVMEFPRTNGFAMADLNMDDENDFLFNDGKQISCLIKDSLSVFARIPGQVAVNDLILLNTKSSELKIGTWSVSLNKLFLFNENGSVYKGFPVKGSRRFFMDEVNNDGRKNILTASDREVLLYVLD